MPTYTIEDLPEIDDYIRRITWRWRSMNEYEDLVQEASIQAWKDITSDREYDAQHIVNRAMQRFRVIATSDHHHFTGYQGRSKDGRRTVPLTAAEEKVRLYRHEHAALHDGYAPTPTQVAEAIGMPRPKAAWAIERVKAHEQRYTSALTRIESNGKERLDVASYKSVPPPAEGDVAATATFRAFGEPSFEDGLVELLTFDQDLERLFPGDTRAHMALRWRHLDGLTVEEIGKRLYPHHKTPQPAASRYLNKLHKVWLADKKAR